ncbi:hypothetical protein [Sinomonas atrocyanea]
MSALMARRRVIAWHRFLRQGTLLALGSGIGLAARIPLAPLISKDGPAYASPALAAWTAIRYPESLAERASTITGALSLTVVVALMLVSAIVFRKSLAGRDAAAALVSGMGWVAPVAVMVGSIALGSYAPRYLQPLFFAPLCTLVLAPRLFPRGIAFIRDLPHRAVTALLAGLVVVLLSVSTGLAGALIRSSSALDPDIQCVDAWITASHRTGAGDFFTTRGPKAYLAQPSHLIQVDQTFRAYPWLADRADYAQSAVSFVLTDSRTGSEHPPLVLPAVARIAPSSTVHCGRYTITDFGTDILPIGPAPAHLNQ